MSVLSIIQDHCRMNALSVPTSAVGSTDVQAAQLLAILQECIDDMIVESEYQAVTYEATFTAKAQEDQGLMSVLAPYGYYQANSETFFDRTLRRPLYGPLNDTQWQEIKALPNPGPFYKFRIRQDRLLVNPAPTAPLSTIAFEYMSTWGVVANDGTAKASITDDMDTFRIPERIVRKWLIQRWKHIKGLPYEDDRQKAYSMLNNYIAKDKAKPRINVANACPTDIRPGVFVPTGSWFH